MNDPWEPIRNPFIVGNPIRGRKMFFGREDDFAYIKTKFTGHKEGGLIVLCGARRSGKTSILFQILDGRLGEDFFPVLIDMQSMAVGNDRDFVRKVIDRVRSAAKDAGIACDQPELTANPYADLEAYIAHVIQKLGERKLVLTFDEYELIETYIDSGVMSAQMLHVLAGMIEHRQVFVIFTGSDKLEARAQRYWDVFLSKALHRRISFLSRDDTLRLVREPVDAIVEYDEGVPARIADLTAGQPFYTQVVCQTLVDLLNDGKRRRATLDDVAKVANEVIENPLPQMIFHWNALSVMEKLCLSVIAEISREGHREVTAAEVVAYAENEKIGYRLDPNAVAKTMEKLFHGDLANKAPSGDAYGFRMDLWRLWTHRMHSVWKVINEIEQADVPLVDAGIVSIRPAARRNLLRIVVGVAIVLGGGLGLWSALDRDAGEPAQRVGAMIAVGKNAGVIAVVSEPAGADVWVDGQLVGRSPLASPIPVGSRAVRLQLAGYRAHEETLTLLPSETTSVDVSLVALTGHLSLTSDPSGAVIAIDGGASGRSTPAVIRDLPANRSHEITLSLKGYSDARYDFDVRADTTVLLFHRFARRTAPLTIASVPPGAELFLDGTKLGTTPVAVPDVAHGPHELRAVLAGYREWSGSIEIPLPDNRLDVTFEKIHPGVIVFSIRPYGDILLDGRPVVRNVTYYALQRDAGVYSIELRNSRYQAHVEEVHVESGDTVRVVHAF